MLVREKVVYKLCSGFTYYTFTPAHFVWMAVNFLIRPRLNAQKKGATNEGVYLAPSKSVGNDDWKGGEMLASSDVLIYQTEYVHTDVIVSIAPISNYRSIYFYTVCEL